MADIPLISTTPGSATDAPDAANNSINPAIVSLNLLNDTTIPALATQGAANSSAITVLQNEVGVGEKISQLTAGGAMQPTDLIPIERSGNNFSVLGSTVVSSGIGVIPGISFASYAGYDPTGATDQSSILNTAINDSITQHLQLRIPAGLYLLNSPINCTPNPDDGLNMVGVSGTGNMTGFNFALGRNGPNVIFKANFNNRPAFYFNTARGAYLGNFGILGTNSFNIFQEMNDVKTNYNTTGARDSRYSPYCGIGIDVTNSAIPPDGGYPSMTYAGSTQDGSSGLIFSNISVVGFVAGIALCPTGVGSQTDTILFDHCTVTGNDTAMVIGQGQSKACLVLFGNWGGNRQAFDGLSYGAQQGFPMPVYGVNFGYLMRLFNYSSQFGPLFIDNCYAESIRSLGNFGSGGSSVRGLCRISNLQFVQHTAQALAPPLVFETFGLAELTSLNMGTDGPVTPAWNFGNDIANPIVLRNITFKAGAVTGIPATVGLSNSGSVVTLDNCISQGTAPFQPVMDSSTIDVSAMAINNRWSGPIRASHYANGTGDVFYTSPNLNGFINAAATGTAFTNRAITFTANPVSGASTGNLTSNWTDLSGWYNTVFNSGAVRLALYKNGAVLVNWQETLLAVTETAATATANIVALTFTATDITLWQLGDMILWKMLPIGGSTVGRTVPGWVVTGIVGSVVTCQPLFDTTYYDTVANNGGGTTLSLVQSQWAPTTALTCTTSTSVNLTAVSPVNLLKQGDWVQGTGLAANSRVVTTDGAGNVVLNKATTASSSGVRLFFGEFQNATVSVAW